MWGPIIANSGICFISLKKFSSAEACKVASGFKIKAYLVLTFFNPILFAFP